MLQDEVREYLGSCHMYASEQWIRGCISYFSENGRKCSGEELKKRAVGQWLLNDITTICPGSLPRDLSTHTNTVLTGTYVLQITASVDIGTSFYKQYLNLKKVNMEDIEATTNSEDRVPTHRMMKFLLHDGAQELIGIEYKPMRCLDDDYNPGCKILVTGPVEYRRGVLLLTDSSVRMLGGGVKEFLERYSTPRLVFGRLGMHYPEANADAIEEFQTSHTEESSTFQVAEAFDDDIDLDQLDTIEEQTIAEETVMVDEVTQNAAKRRSDNSSNQPEKKAKTVLTSTLNNEDFPDDDEIFFDEDEDHLRELEAKIYATEILDSPMVSSEPFVYIKQLNEMSDDEKQGKVFKIKAQIMKLLSKLTVGKGGWSLTCSLVDGTGCIDVEFTNDVLSKLVGYTPQEMNYVKKQMATNPQMKEIAVNSLQNAKNKLQVLYCIIELTMSDVPKITRLTPFEASHVVALQQRMNTSGL